MSPEPTTPTREEPRSLRCVECKRTYAEDQIQWDAGHQQWECPLCNCGCVKFVAESEPAASVLVTREQLIPLICCAFDECPLKDAAKAKGITLDCETDQFNCRADAILARLAASTGARGAVVEEIAAERRRQMESEGWTTAHDDEHNTGELAQAAACYALGRINERGIDTARMWPPAWDIRWWKPKDPRRDLIRAAALIVAEIERLDRLALIGAKQP